MMYPCLTQNLKSMDVSILPMMILTALLFYMRLIAEHSIGGVPYFPSTVISSAWLEVSKCLNMYANAIHVGIL